MCILRNVKTFFSNCGGGALESQNRNIVLKCIESHFEPFYLNVFFTHTTIPLDNIGQGYGGMLKNNYMFFLIFFSQKFWVGGDKSPLKSLLS